MKAHERRYLVVGLSSSLGVASLLALFFGAWGFVAWIALYLVVYDRYPWLHKAITRIANGKE